MVKLEAQFKKTSDFKPPGRKHKATVIFEEDLTKEEFCDIFGQFSQRHIVEDKDFYVKKLQRLRGVNGEFTYFLFLPDKIRVQKLELTDDIYNVYRDEELFTIDQAVTAGFISSDEGAYVAERFLWRPVFNHKHFFSRIELN